MYRTYRTFDLARSFVHSLKLRSVSDWQIYCKSGEKPDDIPVTPNHVYKNDGWESWSNWIGNGNTRNYRPFKEARAFVHSLELKNQANWIKYSRSDDRPKDIPAAPSGAYKNKGWVSMGDWLGTGFIAHQHKAYRPFSEALAFVHTLGLKNRNAWRMYLKKGDKPDDIPADPNNTYKESGWESFGHWLGTGSDQKRKFRPFKDARDFVHSLHIKNLDGWKIYCKSDEKPLDIPADPKKTYKTNEWISWSDWLGTKVIANQNKKYRPFEEARKYVHGLGLRDVAEWKYYCKTDKKPENIPASANQVYKDSGWISFGDWLGTGTIANQRKR
jgi:hypothetical protein